MNLTTFNCLLCWSYISIWKEYVIKKDRNHDDWMFVALLLALSVLWVVGWMRRRSSTAGATFCSCNSILAKNGDLLKFINWLIKLKEKKSCLTSRHASKINMDHLRMIQSARRSHLPQSSYHSLTSRWELNALLHWIWSIHTQWSIFDQSCLYPTAEKVAWNVSIDWSMREKHKFKRVHARLAHTRENHENHSMLWNNFM